MDWEPIAVKIAIGRYVGEEFTVSLRMVSETVLVNLAIQGYDKSAIVWKGEIKEWRWKELLREAIK